MIKNIKKPLTVSFGILFSFIGFANTFWGNDPYYGLAILLISVLFYMPLIDSFRNNLSSKAKSYFNNMRRNVSYPQVKLTKQYFSL